MPQYVFNDPNIGAAAGNIATALFGNPALEAQTAAQRARNNLLGAQTEAERARGGREKAITEKTMAELARIQRQNNAMGAFGDQIRAYSEGTPTAKTTGELLAGVTPFMSEANANNFAQNVFSLINAHNGTPGAARIMAAQGKSMAPGHAFATPEAVEEQRTNLFNNDVVLQNLVNQNNLEKAEIAAQADRDVAAINAQSEGAADPYKIALNAATLRDKTARNDAAVANGVVEMKDAVLGEDVVFDDATILPRVQALALELAASGVPEPLAIQQAWASVGGLGNFKERFWGDKYKMIDKSKVAAPQQGLGSPAMWAPPGFEAGGNAPQPNMVWKRDAAGKLIQQQ